MRALLTGPTGFIGSHLAEELLKKGYKVSCLVRKTSNLDWIDGLDARLCYGDCLDPESLEEAVAGADLVFHLAGLTKARGEKEFLEVNAGGTERLLEAVASRAPSVKMFVFLSSLAAAGPGREGAPVTEKTQPRPVSGYGRSKLEAERIVMRYSETLPVTIIRPPAVYGPRDRDFYVLYKLLSKGVFPYWGRSYYSLVYVEDLVRGLITAAESGKAEGKTYFISDRTPYTNLEIAKVIADALGRRPLRVPMPKGLMPAIANVGRLFGAGSSIINSDKAKEMSYPYWVCDPGRAEKELGFSAQVPMDKGFKWTANWYRIHRWL
ncbi:MAG: NAD-dependent epimerase/dehydratase family protein [Nitrospirota bacterium]|jgi:nucleoside-diphosphate-sugar epimerase